MSDTIYLRDPHAYSGRVEMRPFESEALRGNRAGDSHVREVPVYLPPGHEAGARFPVLFVLVGFTGRAHSQLETHPWRAGLVTRFDRAVQAGDVPPAILVLPDAFTSLGGSQYVNSSYLGNYEDYIATELVGFVDGLYPTLPGRRGVVGKSSGGFGAMHLAMRHPDVFPVCASISGDCHFEFGYAQEFLDGVRALARYDDPDEFLAAFRDRPKLDKEGHAAINLLAMSACYSPSEAPLGFDLPVDLHTGERIEAVWQRWLEFDPVLACERYAENLRRLEVLHLEAGRNDEFHLQFGLRILARRLKELDVPFDHEEHGGGHFDLDERYDLLLPRLIAALGG